MRTTMRFIGVLLCLSSLLTSVFADSSSIQGCGGFVEASSSLIKSRKPSDAKLDYSHITVELRTLDGLVKDSTQCAPNGYSFIPVYDTGSFVIKIKGPQGWSWDPNHVPVIIDHNGCNANADINFHFTGFTISGRVAGAIGGESCALKHGGPSNVKVDLLSTTTDDVIASALTNSLGAYVFTNIIPAVDKQIDLSNGTADMCSNSGKTKQGEGLRQYYLQHIHDLQLTLHQKTHNLNRLEAQRNELNSRVKMLREELQLLQEPGSYVGEVVKVMGKSKVLVKVFTFHFPELPSSKDTLNGSGCMVMPCDNSSAIGTNKELHPVQCWVELFPC